MVRFKTSKLEDDGCGVESYGEVCAVNIVAPFDFSPHARLEIFLTSRRTHLQASWEDRNIETESRDGGNAAPSVVSEDEW